MRRHQIKLEKGIIEKGSPINDRYWKSFFGIVSKWKKEPKDLEKAKLSDIKEIQLDNRDILDEAKFSDFHRFFLVLKRKDNSDYINTLKRIGPMPN